MSASLRCHVRRSLILVVAATLILLSVSAPAPLKAADEVRALWVVRTSLTTPSAIATMVDAAKAGGFNTLLVQIRGRGDAYYARALEPRPASLTTDPAFDPLALTIARAHTAGLQVHAWVNVNLVADASDLPMAREHVIYRHPEWLMVPRALANDLAGVDPRAPEYLERLAQHARSLPTELEGLYLSPISAAAADYTVAVVRDIADRYAVEGVHLDYIRYPNDTFDYSPDALLAFRQSLVGDLLPDEVRRLDARLRDNPLMYTDEFPQRWRAFRGAKLTALVSQLKQTVGTVRPAARLSAAVLASQTAADNRFQNWSEWIRQGLVDVVCPMAYTTDGATFASQVAVARGLAGGDRIWAGIGAYQLSPERILENVQTARRLGAGGIALFSYDGLTDSGGAGYVVQIGRAAFGNH